MKRNYFENKLYDIYVYLDPRKNGTFKYDDLIFYREPVYVGISYDTDRRNKRHIYDLFDESKNKNFIKVNKFLKIKNDTGEYPEMIIYKHGVNLEDALAIEKELILKIGRIQLRNGPLCNATDGGDGNFGSIVSEETREKMSLSHIGKKQSELTRELRSKSLKKYYSVNKRVLSEETKEKLRILRIGSKHTDTSKKKMSDTLRGRKLSEKQKELLVKLRSKKYKIIFPDKSEKIIENLKSFCEENDLNYKAMNNVFRGKAKQHRGFFVSTV
jgi:hypothetical protein